jgi:23S rRNA (pseudouridine1915-N3)-methyltransferase
MASYEPHMLQLRLITVSNKAPSWINEGFQEYAKRLSSVLSFDILEIPVEKRGNQKNMQPLIEKEGEKILAAIKPQHTVIALDVKGKMWSTEELASRLKNWQLEGKNIDFIVGGPDGLSAECLKRAQIQWSLSPLTLPHLLVRIVIAEQIYRAWSILQGHPYHK